MDTLLEIHFQGKHCSERHEFVPERLLFSTVAPVIRELNLDGVGRTASRQRRKKKLACTGNSGMPWAGAKKIPPKPESNNMFVLRLPHMAAEPQSAFASAAG